MKIRKRLHEISSGIWLSVVACFMFFLYAPTELLFTNQDEFWFDLYILLPPMLVVFMIMLLGSIFVFFLFHMWGTQKYRIFLLLYFIAFICSYIQGNWLAGGLPALDGTPIDWSLYTAERIKSVILWVLVAAVAMIAYRKLKETHFYKLVSTVSICMLLMLFVTLLTLALENDGLAKKSTLAVTTKGTFEMSEDTNFIILILDAADGMRMEDMLASNDEYSDIFRDFTFYDNMVGAYPFTKHSIPFILTGQWFEHETAFDEYEAAAYASSPFFATMEEAGYQMSLYTSEVLLKDYGKERFDNILPGKRGVTDSWAFARWQMLMTIFKYAPYDLKRVIVINPNAFRTLKIAPEEAPLFTTSNKTFYENVLNEELSYTEQKCFKFIHIDGAHLPYTYDENVNEIENATYESSLQASLTITNAYLNKLKDNHVYDNSVIIIMADHGFNDEMHHFDAIIRQNPIFFVKGINEHHDLVTSHAPVSFEDLQEAYQRLLAGKQSNEIFDWKEGDHRNRRVLVYEYKKDDPMIEYIQPGNARDTDLMYQTGNIYTQK